MSGLVARMEKGGETEYTCPWKVFIKIKRKLSLLYELYIHHVNMRLISTLAKTGLAHLAV